MSFHAVASYDTPALIRLLSNELNSPLFRKLS